jgi:outer membrane protein assembly factor BamB
MVWRKNLRTEFAGRPGNWAYSESPLIDGEKLVCTPGGDEATVVALNKNTGDVLWKCDLSSGDKAAYASPMKSTARGVTQYVVFAEKGLAGIDAGTGKELWRYQRTAQGSPANIPTPIVHQDFVYSAASRTGGGLVRVTGAEGALQVEEVYFSPKLPTAIGGAVRVGEYLYGTTGQAMVCADFATGELKWEERSVAPGAVCYADGNLYLKGENGDMALIAASPEAYREKGRFTPKDQPDRDRSKAWTHPVIANGRLFLRDIGSLWCYDVRSQ